jgi:hypothetical protein
VYLRCLVKMADTTGHQPGDTYTSAQPVTSDIPASQPSPAVQPGLPNGATLPHSRTSSGAPSTSTLPNPGPPPAPPLPPTLPNHGPPPAPPPPSVPSTQVSAPPAPPAPMVPSGQVTAQTPVVPSERPVGTMNYLSSGTPARTPNQYQRQPFPQQQAYQQMPQPIYHGQHPAQYAHPQAPRPLIVDPPRRSSVVPSMIPPQPQQSNGFPSPGRDYGAENRKFNDDLSRITLSFQQGIPEAVRRGVRDNWEKCLLGSEFHQAFVVSPTFKPFCEAFLLQLPSRLHLPHLLHTIITTLPPGWQFYKLTLVLTLIHFSTHLPCLLLPNNLLSTFHQPLAF